MRCSPLVSAPTWERCLERVRIYALVEKVSLEVRVESLVRCSFVLSALACGSTCESAASFSFQRGFAPPPWALTLWNCKPKRTFFSKLPLLWCASTATEKVTNTLCFCAAEPRTRRRGLCTVVLAFTGFIATLHCECDLQ